VFEQQLLLHCDVAISCVYLISHLDQREISTVVGQLVVNTYRNNNIP